MENQNDEPVICSKCNKTFESESEYLEHYNEKHKPEDTKHYFPQTNYKKVEKIMLLFFGFFALI